MNAEKAGTSAFPLSRRAVLGVGGATLLSGAAVLAGARPARAAYNLIWSAWGAMAGYGVSTECNPGGGGFSCGPGDVAIVHGSQFTEVTANPNGHITFVNAIGNRKFTGTTPDGAPVMRARYQYVYAIRLPRVPTTTSAPWIGEQTHQMIQYWDGRDPSKNTLEAASFWKLNPWSPDHGKIMVYTRDGNGNLAIHDPQIRVEPDTNWHVFDIRADLANKVYDGISIDGHWNPLTNVPLAQIHHPDWGTDLSLILTAESENAYPGSPPIVTQWTTQFKDPKLYRFA
jgi:hypothetical protein